MSLSPGHKLAHYEILEPIGKGGMGEVYRARDGKLGRDVAIKVLPDEFARDTERLARFKREAKVLASLNHPGIAAIYGLEESEGTHYLVLELVPGETLAERISRGPIPIDEAVPLFIQIAEGLEAAHERGIIHRDLKPANAKLTEEGRIKILDFGLAKALAGDDAGAASALSQSPTLSRQATVAGVILGTAAYMSPEQAKGKPVDRRADIWSFGVVLFEMLTGRRLFTGEMMSDVLASVLRAEPDWSSLPTDASPALVKLLRRCLARDPKARLQHIGDARLELTDTVAWRELTAAAPVDRVEPAPAMELGGVFDSHGVRALANAPFKRHCRDSCGHRSAAGSDLPSRIRASWPACAFAGWLEDRFFRSGRERLRSAIRPLAGGG